jgi:hypothetical protein
MPNEVVFGQVSSPNDLNQLVDILQRRAGQQETGKYFVAGWSGGSGDTLSNFIPSLSRNTTDLEEQEGRARAASVMLHAANPNMTNDFPAFAALFIEWDLIGYQWQCACSDANPPAEAEKEKETMLQLGNERTVQGLLPRAVQIVAEREQS